MAQDGFISIRKAEVNNLKGISLDIPRNKLTVITGVSGSGKSSLAFDTLFAEGQRRFAESVSSFARQFLGRLSKPAVESISGIPPAVAIEQKVNTRNPRSTVGTSTEIYDYLRILYARIGRTFSPVSGEEVKCDTPSDVLSYIGKESGAIYLFAEMAQSSERRTELLLSLKEQGFSRLALFTKGDASQFSVAKIDDVLQSPEKYDDAELHLLIHRLKFSGGEMDGDTETALRDSVATAFKQGEGRVGVVTVAPEGEIAVRHFSNIFEADGLLFDHLNEWDFNFNSPLGACPVCGGLGKTTGIDEALVIPNGSLSIYQEAIACWRGKMLSYFKDQIVYNSEKYDIPVHTPYNELPQRVKELIWDGTPDFCGIRPFFKELEAKRYKIQNKYMLSRYTGRTVCGECGGSRLKKETRYVRVGGKTISELMEMSVTNLRAFFDGLELTEYEQSIVSRALKEITGRLDCIINVGLGYLTLGRASNTLSGGESQRINLVSSLGNSLTGSMYILDEPSIGLHQRDTGRLISVIKALRDLGNTVVVVEHDEEMIRAADWVVDIGPAAGVNGGEVVFAGPPPAVDTDEAVKRSLLAQYPRSLTLQYLLGEKRMDEPSSGRQSSSYIEVCGACENNLKNIDVRFPLKMLTVVCGVSGSGKSSLVGDILYPALYRHVNQTGARPGAYRELRGALDKVMRVEYVDQNPIGKNARSNPATYIKVYDDIRHLFSEQPYARLNGYGHSHFSFNIDGGRCPVCQGEGVVKIPMQFMADITMVCESCGGKRFLPDILEVKYRGKNISDVLDLSVDEAVEFFSAGGDRYGPVIAEKLRPLQDVGLGYVKLGQSNSTLSGGESQRIKLASFLGQGSGAAGDAGGVFFIFDEPTTGLHFDDIHKLLASFRALVGKGHTIVVVEHNPYVIGAADHLIELGPEGGDGGGYLLRG